MHHGVVATSRRGKPQTGVTHRRAVSEQEGRPVPNDGEVVLHGGRLTIDEVVQVARGGAKVRISKQARSRVEDSRRIVDELVAQREVAYGITTGFGEFAHVTIDPDKVGQLQENLLKSHAAGVDKPLERDVVRAMMLIRAEALSIGASGIRLTTLERLVEFLNRDLVPVVPSKGSLGASGDLAPLAHMSLPLIGLGELWVAGERQAAQEVLKNEGLEPLELGAKEGLALINGTCLMAAVGALVVRDAWDLLADAHIAGAMSLEALEGTDQAFIPEISMLRPHPGQGHSADLLYALTQDSQIMQSHRNCPKVQDAYTLRCMPQVYGAVLDTLAFVQRTMAIEIRSATDNPLILPDRGGVSGGNFHGEPLALALDYLAVALADLGNMIERRIDRLVNPHVSGMTAFLVEAGGLNSGYMVAQYTAAALATENKVLAHPASADSIPTSANQEDHVSMGATAALKAMHALRNVRRIVAIEYMCAAQGLDIHAPLKAGPGVEAAHEMVRRHVPKLESDRVLAPDMDKIARLVEQGVIREAVKQAGFDVDLQFDPYLPMPETRLPDEVTPDPVPKRRVQEE